MYAISDGTLQIYAIEGSSLVRTSELKVAANQLESSLFSDNKLYLSDFIRPVSGGSGYSALHVYDLGNPAFPRKLSSDQRLPGGHTSILATNHGILSVGSVLNLNDAPGSWIKLGLFANPVTTEKAYLILGTDLGENRLEPVESQHFNRAANRLFVPYTGFSREESDLQEARIGVSRVEPDEIVSEGALQLPEVVTRVRARPGTTDQLLAFGESSVNWLTHAASEWQATPVLAYYTPIALYRLSEQDDYVEVLKLGKSCKLRFVKQSQLNQRTAESEGQALPCSQYGAVWAYGHNIVFGATTGVRFDDDGTVEALEPVEVEELFEKRAQRRACLFGDDPTHESFNPHNPPPVEQLRCYSQEAYQTLVYGTDE